MMKYFRQCVLIKCKTSFVGRKQKDCNHARQKCIYEECKGAVGCLQASGSAAQGENKRNSNDMLATAKLGRLAFAT